MRYYNILLLSCITLTSLSCTSNPRQDTLRDVDVINKSKQRQAVFIKPKTSEEIKSAYLQYFKQASRNNHSRMEAISRLAQIEFELTDKLIENKNTDSKEFDDDIYNARMDKTINLLKTSLKDYPNEKTNDRILYQLSKAYEQRGTIDKSIDTLLILTKKFPKSPYYVESQFRIGEAAFSKKDYITAEDAYTEVISSKKNDVFYEKSTFKRAWSRYKQGYYLESVDDIATVIKYHNFDKSKKLDKSEKSLFNEYYRTIGLAFAYAGGLAPLRKYTGSNSDKKLNYDIYNSLSKVFTKQERYSDAVAIMEDYILSNKNSLNTPYAYLEIMNIWQKGGFSEKLNFTINRFYTAYNPSSSYWSNNASKAELRLSIKQSLKKHILQMTSHFHKRYQKTRKVEDFRLAERWYVRYLKDYKAHVNKDNVNYLYAELLSSANKEAKGLPYYEKSAYDNKIILDKNSAYATIITTDKLVAKYKGTIERKNRYLSKHIEYSNRFIQLYPNDKRSFKIQLHAAELALANKKYTEAISLSNQQINSKSTKDQIRINIIAAQAFFNLKNYQRAEEIYTSLLPSITKNTRNYTNLADNIALAIYKQGETAKKSNKLVAAAEHFKRASYVVPQSKHSPTGLYDSIAILMKLKDWRDVIKTITIFKQLYPKHKYTNNITKNLSIAYLNTNQDIKAANEYENLSNIDSNSEVKKSSLLQAAKLYEQKNNYISAIRSYSKYTSKYKTPYTQYLESMNKLATLYKQTNQPNKEFSSLKTIIKEDRNTAKKHKTSRTNYIASNSYLLLATKSENRYKKQSLTRPLKKNLKKKKKHMQSTIKLYGKASSYKLSKPTSQATYSIADIYLDFSKALLNSELPPGLSNTEKEQYKILLEDKAFPFEEKSIEFHEINMTQTKNNIYNSWIEMSKQKLKELYPVRYNRELKIDEYVNVLH